MRWLYDNDNDEEKTSRNAMPKGFLYFMQFGCYVLISSIILMK